MTASWQGAVAPAEQPRIGPASTGPRGAKFERARKYVAKMDPAISGQNGHGATWAVARKCAADFELSEAETLDMLREFNKRCEPPWSERELAHKAADAVRKARVANPVGDREQHWQMPREHYESSTQEDWQPRDEDAPGAPPANKLEFSTISARLRAKRKLGPRHPTGIGALDELLRGGLQVEKTVVIGGAPGAGKTTLCCQVGDHLSRHGVAVGWLAIDEEPAGIDARRLQVIGVSRELAEEPDESTITLAEEALGSIPFEMFEDSTIEDVFEAMAEKYPNQPRAVVFDSLQTVRTRQTSNIESIRERISDVVHTAKRFSRSPKTRALVFFTSELARGAYRSKNTDDRTEDLAAFKESGAIEYGGHVLLVLRTAEGDASVTHVAIPKNRVGSKGQFALRLNFEMATFTPVEAEPQQGRGATSDRLASLRSEIVFALKGETGLMLGALKKLVPRNRTNFLEALDQLLTAGVVVKHGKLYALKSEVKP